MNTRVYGSVFKKRFFLILVTALVVAVLAVVFTGVLPEQKNVSLSIAVDVSDKQETPDYKFSRYYGAEASEKFATTVSSWFQSPEIVQRIFEDANLDPGTTSLRGLAKIFDSEPLSAQHVVVDFVTGSEDDAQKLLTAINSMVQRKTEDLNREEEAVFVSLIAEPIIITKERAFLINGVVGLVVGIVIGFFLAAIIQYWQPVKSGTDQD